MLKRRWRWVGLGIALMILGSWFVFFVISKLHGLRQDVQSAQVLGDFSYVAYAMLTYQDHYGTLPPAAVYDADGKPLLSWRVLLLPYMEGQKLYEQFKLDEPWDSPHNLKLLDQMPSPYGPYQGPISAKPYTTFVQVFVGPGAAFEGQHGLNTKTDFSDGPANTILLVTAAEAVQWTKPAELSYHPDLPLPRLGGPFPDHFHVALANGKARRFYHSISHQTLRAAITRNGGETLGADW